MGKVAVLDMYDGVANQGMRAILEILKAYQSECFVQVFDVRGKAELPGMDFDLYISTGGPGNPLEGDGIWDKAYFELIDRIFDHNESQVRKKYLMLICHSFQMVSNHLGIGKITKRRSMSFGTFPTHKTKEGEAEPMLMSLDDPFWVADFRKWQLVQADESQVERLGVKILALEKIRPHVDLERAIMMIRFSPEIIGTQFHPEGDAHGMLAYFQQADKRADVIEQHGEEKYQQMIRDLSHPGRIQKTRDTVIPFFIESSLKQLMSFEPVPSSDK